MEENWAIRPRTGLGPLRFEMSETEARVLADNVYGELESEGPIGFSSNNQVYQVLVETMGEDAAREAMSALDEGGVEYRSAQRVNYVAGLMLDFVAGRLEDMMCHSAAEQLHIDGLQFFGTDPIPALARLQALNGEPPLVKGPDCHFRNLYLTAFECLRVLPGGLVRATHEGTDEARQKTIGWRAKPRNPDEDFSGHQAIDLSA